MKPSEESPHPQDSVPSRLSVWVQAARLKTLWASVAPVLVGTSLAWRDGAFHSLAAAAALLGALALQVAANFANDLYDFERGTDTEERTGPLRVTQAGLVSPPAMRRALVAALAFAFLIGVYLVMRGGWPIVAIGLSSILATIFYTGGPRPYGYIGLGELFVFLFFGIIAVTGTYYVQSLTVTPTAFILSLPMGFLSVAILVVNNLRDIDTDRQSGKKTLAVRLGLKGARRELAIMFVCAALVPILLIESGLCGFRVFAASFAMIGAFPLMRTVYRTNDGPAMNRVLAQTAWLQLIYAVVVAVSVNL
jgi:1,4-dihydroxy-2-naphthoate octaprenyltransferase